MHEIIQKQIPEAMRAKDSVRLTTLRGILAGFVNEVITLGKKPQDKLKDEEAIIVIKRLVRQRKDSIEQFEKGNRQDLVDKESAELKILEEFLPVQMSEEKIREITKLKIQELKITDKSKIGILIGAVLKEARGNADGALVKKIVESVFVDSDK